MFYCIYTCTANNEVRQLTNFTTVVSLKRLHDYNTYKGKKALQEWKVTVYKIWEIMRQCME